MTKLRARRPSNKVNSYLQLLAKMLAARSAGNEEEEERLVGELDRVWLTMDELESAEAEVRWKRTRCGRKSRR